MGDISRRMEVPGWPQEKIEALFDKQIMSGSSKVPAGGRP
jgi:hypothetical protein